MRARKADISRPYMMDGIAQWALATDVASIEVWTKENDFLWGYTAPWYHSSQQKMMDGLYDLRPRNSLERGAAKPLNNINNP